MASEDNSAEIVNEGELEKPKEERANEESNQDINREEPENKNEAELEENRNEANENITPRSTSTSDSKMKNQMMAELERVKKEMIYSASLIKRPKAKPYTPDIFNDLGPYYNKYLIDYITRDQDPLYKSWGTYGQRETALQIVDPEMSLKMDTFPLPPVHSKVPGQVYKIKVWSKNLSGKDQELGSTRLPPVPSLGVKKLANPEYQHFKMTFDEVPKFRQDVKKMYSAIELKREKSDYQRVQKDWKRMNLDELKELPERSRVHYGKAVSTYLGTSKGSSKAVHQLGSSMSTPEQT
eukprot:gene8275-14231_t